MSFHSLGDVGNEVEKIKEATEHGKAKEQSKTATNGADEGVEADLVHDGQLGDLVVSRIDPKFFVSVASNISYCTVNRMMFDVITCFLRGF